jgi:hypothetical protein
MPQSEPLPMEVPKQLVFLRVSQQVNKLEATSSKGLWEVEVVGYPRTYGAIGR